MENKYKLQVLDKESLLDLFQYELPGKFQLSNLLNKDILLEIGLKYGLVYNFHRVDYEKIGNMEIILDNIMEARFFNEEREIRIFRDEDGLRASIFLENNSPHIKKTSLLYPRYGEKIYGDKIDYKNYIDYDEDNQAYIRYTKPCRVYFKEANR